MDRELKRVISDGRPAGSWLSLPSPEIAELVASLGFDFVVIDTEHAPMTTETVTAMVRGVEAADGSTAPLVRVAWNDPVRIKRVLDTGAAGVMAPQVSTPEEARELVDATRYPPDGVRGVAASRATGYGLSFEEYLRTAGQGITTIAQIETPAAAEHAGEISATEGLDAVLVGPADLSTALGIPLEYDDPTFEQAVTGVLDSVSTPVGTLATSDGQIDRWLDLGFDFLVVGKDTGYLADGALAALDRYDRQVTRQ